MTLKMSALPGHIYPAYVLADKHVYAMLRGSILIFQSKAYIVAKAKNKNKLCEDCAMEYEIKEGEEFSNFHCGCKLGDVNCPCKADHDSNFQLLSKNNISKDFVEGL